MLVALFLFLELLLPAAFFLGMAIAAGLLGLLLLAWPEIPWEWQLIGFSLLAIVTIWGWRRYLWSNPIRSDRPRLNRRGEQYVGRVFTLEHPIVNGRGKLKVDDTTWKVRGEDCPAATRVRVTGVEGVELLVEAEGSDGA